MSITTQTSNPLALYAQSKLGLEPIWNFDEQTCTHNRMLLTSIRQMHDNPFLTVPGSIDYLPPMRLNLPFKAWLEHAQELYARSALAFVADVYSSILSRKGEIGSKNIHMLWDDLIPLPTPASALFWLMHCETWPVIHSELERLGKQSGLHDIFPPQAIVLPQHLHLTNQSLHGNGYAKHLRESVGHYGLSYLMSTSLSRSDRENFARMNPDSQIVFRPAGMVSMLSHMQKNDSLSRSVNQNHARGKLVQPPIGVLDAGHGLNEIRESNLVLEQINKLRAKIMDRASIIPGLPTHSDNLYGSPGVLWRAYNETHLTIRGDTSHVPMVHDGSLIQIDDQTIDGTPPILPRIWMGWSLPAESIGDPQANQSMMRWVANYQAFRAYAVRCLMDPMNQFDSFNAYVMDDAVNRHKRLAKAGRIVSTQKQAEKNQLKAIRSAFENTAFKF